MVVLPVGRFRHNPVMLGLSEKCWKMYCKNMYNSNSLKMYITHEPKVTEKCEIIVVCGMQVVPFPKLK